MSIEETPQNGLKTPKWSTLDSTSWSLTTRLVSSRRQQEVLPVLVSHKRWLPRRVLGSPAWCIRRMSKALPYAHPVKVQSLCQAGTSGHWSRALGAPSKCALMQLKLAGCDVCISSSGWKAPPSGSRPWLACCSCCSVLWFGHQAGPAVQPDAAKGCGQIQAGNSCGMCKGPGQASPG